MIPPTFHYEYEVKAKIQEIEEQAARFRRVQFVTLPSVRPRYNALFAALGGWLVRRGEAIEARYSEATIQPQCAH